MSPTAKVNGPALISIRLSAGFASKSPSPVTGSPANGNLVVTAVPLEESIHAVGASRSSVGAKPLIRL